MNLLHNFSSIFRRASSAHLNSSMMESAMRRQLENLPLLMPGSQADIQDAEQEPAVPEPALEPASAAPSLADTSGAESEADGAMLVYQRAGARAALFKAGQQLAHWDNPFISHAMPAVLQLRRMLEAAESQLQIRAQLGLELKLFRERLGSAGCEWQQAQDASYLLCTYLDEICNDAARGAGQQPYDGERSLLVEFHDDAWGGEDAFADLQRCLRHEPPPLQLLAWYELVLALGWQGRYRVLERGEVLLQDLRSQLHATIWRQQEPAPLGTGLITPPAVTPAPEPPPPKQRWLTPWRVAVIALAATALTYGLATASLDQQGRRLREALAAWTPPARAINLATALPPPLPQLLSEGWLVAYKHPQGWLLIFRSDGAFDVGKAEVRASFQKNIVRLGQAFAPWPGDLEVIGHTDRVPIQTSAFPNNQRLSEARARSVADMLRQTAVAGGAQAPDNAKARRIDSSGLGESAPLDAARTPEAYARNRRVDVLWKVAGISLGGGQASSAASSGHAAAPPPDTAGGPEPFGLGAKEQQP